MDVIIIFTVIVCIVFIMLLWWKQLLCFGKPLNEPSCEITPYTSKKSCGILTTHSDIPHPLYVVTTNDQSDQSVWHWCLTKAQYLFWVIVKQPWYDYFTCVSWFILYTNLKCIYNILHFISDGLLIFSLLRRPVLKTDFKGLCTGDRYPQS